MGKGQAERAAALAAEIIAYARADAHRELLAIADDPATPAMLEEMSQTDRRQVSIHLEGARRWRERQNERARVKLDSVEKAISEFDVVLARGLLRKIDWKLLDEGTLERYNLLAMDVTALTIEMEDLERRLPAPEPKPKRGRRLWNRSD